MRKLIFVSALALLSTSAVAGGSRGLSMPQPIQAQAVEQQSPIRRAEVTVLPGPAEQPAVTAPPSVDAKSDGTLAAPAPARIQTLAPVQAQAPVQTQPAPAPVQAQPAPAPAQAAAPAPAKPVVHASKPSRKKHVARRGERDERKARRIAARFGIYW